MGIFNFRPQETSFKKDFGQSQTECTFFFLSLNESLRVSFHERAVKDTTERREEDLTVRRLKCTIVVQGARSYLPWMCWSDFPRSSLGAGKKNFRDETTRISRCANRNLESGVIFCFFSRRSTDDAGSIS